MSDGRFTPPRDELARYLKINRLLVGAALPSGVALHLGWPSNRYFLLELLAAAYWLFLGWLRNRRPVWPDERIVQTLCVGQWAVSFAAVSVEPWAIHLVPLFCVVRVLIAARSLDHDRHKHLVLAAAFVILAATVWSRILGNGPIHLASSIFARNFVAVTVTPSLGAFIAWLAWRNQRTMWLERDQVQESRERLAVAGAKALARFDSKTTDISRRLRAVTDEVVSRGPGAAGSLSDETQLLAQDLRLTTQELGAPEVRLDVDADLERLVATVTQPVELATGPLGSRLSVVDAVLREVITDLLRPATNPTSSILAIWSEADSIVLEVENDFAEEPEDEAALSVASFDRLQAIGGFIEIHRTRSGTVARCVVPLAPPKNSPNLLAGRDLISDLRYGLGFPVAAFGMSLGLWMTILPYAELRDVAIITAVIFTLPCLVAVTIARARPGWAIGIFSTSHWLTAIVIAERLNIVKYFAAIALLIPLVLALRYVGRKVYTALTVGTSLATAVAIGVARLDRQLEVLQDAPDRVTDIVVIALVPLPSTVLLLLSHRNHASMSISTEQLRRSRRELVAAAHHAQRTLERDLHDGAQQRLVSAALRLQIAARQTTDREVQRNLGLAADELREADKALRSLRHGEPLVMVDGDALLSSLAALRVANVVPVHLDLRIEPERITTDEATTLWFCCSEAVANAMKHGSSLTQIRVEISTDDQGDIVFRVEDDGGGMKREPKARSTGLLNMKERLEAHGGRLDVSSSDSGTTVAGRMPASRWAGPLKLESAARTERR